MSAPVLLSDVLAELDRAYPAELTESWDTGVGLTCGDPAEPVERVLVAVDVDPAVVDEAVAGGVQLLVTHHPLLFRAVQSVAADRDKGALVHRMIRHSVAHLAAHTNADRAADGVNDALARCLGLVDLRPLVPVPDQPTIGLGRIGRVDVPTDLAGFAQRVAERLPATATGVRVAGDPDRPVRTVAVLGGAGDGELSTAASAGVDVYLTSDLRHHVVGDFVAVPGRPAVVEVAHWAGEWPWVPVAAARLRTAFPGLDVRVSHRRTDPWTFVVPSGGPATPGPGPGKVG
ncbi:Nif3-like dinuclear metal center hexameric protein [Nakamurella flava]|uniref:GTP cyclohydrolase 1 type 2 homolog n=1 Tax=Nakamurella flava TaxID=2576308 RepID=A0A4U6QJ23_9ACTN|nr:Nif3-like dinuclear metal center hexameric protein [Nakamurella flava]TKV60427.1 Nif3-like dinuclear metal center hexameric protein [Nakamurella flava]